MSPALLTMVATLTLTQPASDAVTPEQARKAVERSLPYIKREGMAWIRERHCHSCHHVGFMVWTLNDANRRGMKVDLAELKVASEWAVRYATYDAVFYQVKPPTLAAAMKAGIAEEQLGKLKDLSSLYTLRGDFHAELARVLGKETLEQHEDLLFKSASISGQGGKGEDADPKGTRGPGTVASELLLAGAPALTGNQDDTKALVQRLITTQEKDGSWKHGAQYNAFKRTQQESTEVVTAWNALALHSYDGNLEAAAKTRERAVEYLKRAKPGASAEWYVAQALLARALKDTDRAESLMKDLRGQQMPDGGWAWIKDNKDSDAYATGAALYAMGVSGADNTDPSVVKGWSFLIKTQRDSGDWLVPAAYLRKGGAKKTTDPIFSYWGTGWASIGIMQTLPK